MRTPPRTPPHTNPPGVLLLLSSKPSGEGQELPEPALFSQPLCSHLLESEAQEPPGRGSSAVSSREGSWDPAPQLLHPTAAEQNRLCVARAAQGPTSAEMAANKNHLLDPLPALREIPAGAKSTKDDLQALFSEQLLPPLPFHLHLCLQPNLGEAKIFPLQPLPSLHLGGTCRGGGSDSTPNLPARPPGKKGEGKVFSKSFLAQKSGGGRAARSCSGNL